VEGLFVQLHSLAMDKFHAGLEEVNQVFGVRRTYTPSDHYVQRHRRHIHLNTYSLRLLSAIRINNSKSLARFRQQRRLRSTLWFFMSKNLCITSIHLRYIQRIPKSPREFPIPQSIEGAYSGKHHLSMLLRVSLSQPNFPSKFTTRKK